MFSSVAIAVPDQLSLFASPVSGPEGLRFKEELISQAEEAALVARFAALPFAPFQFRGFEGRRRVASFGWGYDFTARRPLPAPALPGWLESLRGRAAEWAGVDPTALRQAAVLEYGPGAPIGWHRDRPIYEDVIGVSLLSPRTLRLRRPKGSGWERTSVTLTPRSVYLLRGPVRDEWEHSIPPGDRLRYSVMFRTLRPDHPGARHL